LTTASEVAVEFARLTPGDTALRWAVRFPSDDGKNHFHRRHSGILTKPTPLISKPFSYWFRCSRARPGRKLTRDGAMVHVLPGNPGIPTP
jgi:hypothetical protein